MRMLLLALIVMVPWCSWAETSPDCSQSALQHVRRQAHDLFSQHHYQLAKKQLQQFAMQCQQTLNDYRHQAAMVRPLYWFKSDLLAAQLKTGDYAACAAKGMMMLDGWLSPLRDMADSHVYKAIAYNRKQCLQHFKKRYQLDTLTSTPCPIPETNGVLLAGSTPDAAMCLEQVSGKQQVSAANAFRIWKQRGQHAQRQDIFITDAGFASLDLCGKEAITTGNVAGQRLVRLQGELTYCHPGSAVFYYDGVFTYQHAQLTLLKEIFVPLK